MPAKQQKSYGIVSTPNECDNSSDYNQVELLQKENQYLNDVINQQKEELLKLYRRCVELGA